MSYEYSSEGQQLSNFNPYRVENMLLAARAAVLLVGGLLLLVLARKHLQAQAWASVLLPLAMGVLLVVTAVRTLIVMARQLKIFFGRGQPEGLAGELGPDQVGSGRGSEELMQNVRQGALEFAVPKGPLNGVLYALTPDLITAPRYVQQVLQKRFANLAAYAFLLLTMLMAQVFVWGTPAQGWAGLFYLGVVLTLAVLPVLRNAARSVTFQVPQIVALIVLAVLGPALLGTVAGKLPDLSWASFGAQAFTMLVALIAVEIVSFLAVREHIDPPPPVSKVDTVGTVSFNADPNVLMQELDREMQRNWVHRIPNRRYARLLPQVAIGQRSGNFLGRLLEETQPQVPSALARMDWATVLAFPRFFWLMVIDLIGVAFTLLGVGALATFAVLFEPNAQWTSLLGYVTLGAVLCAVGGYAFASAHWLWGRFDYESTLTWIEMEGSFIRSKVDLGNRLQDRVFSEREVVTVEHMTLRVWVTQIRTVVFGHHGDGSATARALTAMSGMPDQAGYLRDLVTRFAGDQSIVVAPGSQEDARRMVNLNALNQLGGGHAVAPPLPSPLQGATFVEPAAVAASSGGEPHGDAPAHCSQCGAAPRSAATFCEDCGTRLVTA